jgi:hypothetical protein
LPGVLSIRRIASISRGLRSGSLTPSTSRTVTSVHSERIASNSRNGRRFGQPVACAAASSAIAGSIAVIRSGLKPGHIRARLSWWADASPPNGELVDA